ncbi:MAG: MJ0042-type zinc finger domain-containing protein, partial [Pseudomonadota bacterium]|nr:MJ0042-type zinc finger domain-containing protein [Pseudomonadota bacterium]
MYVACPSCKSLYQIELIHLRAAGGELHCGACKTTFNATAAVFDDPQQALDYADQHPLQEGVAREIDDLVNKALGHVPEHEHVTEAADSQTSEEVVADSEQISDASAAFDDVVRIVPEAGERGEETDAKAETPVAPVVEDVIEAPDEQVPGPAAVEGIVEEMQVHGLLRADMDVYACPVAAEFQAQRPQRASEALEPSAALLYSDESHDSGLRVPWGAIAASILLAVLLLAQLAWVERYQLVRFPQLRSV